MKTMLEAYSLQTGRTTIDLDEVVEYSHTIHLINKIPHKVTKIITRYNAKHTLLIPYDDFQQQMNLKINTTTIKTF